MVLILTGTYDVKLDAKQRLAVPSKWRNRMADEHSMFATLGEGTVIWLYPASAFMKRVDALEYSQKPKAEVLAYERRLFANTHEVELDGQGRIRLPEQLLSKVELGRELTVLGNRDHLELYDRHEWKKIEKENDKLMGDNPDIIQDPRRMVDSRLVPPTETGN